MSVLIFEFFYNIIPACGSQAFRISCKKEGIFAVKTAQLDENLNLIGLKETDMRNVNLTINHTRPMPLGNEKYFYVGWNAASKISSKIDFGSAVLTY